MTLEPPLKVYELSWNLRALMDLPEGSFPNHLRKSSQEKSCPLPWQYPDNKSSAFGCLINLRNKKLHSFLFLFWLATFICTSIYPSVLFWFLCCLFARHWNRSQSGEERGSPCSWHSPKPKKIVFWRGKTYLSKEERFLKKVQEIKAITINGVISLSRHCSVQFVCISSFKKQHKLMAKRLSSGARLPGLNSSPMAY